jgi:hypothetical protein
MSDRKYQNLIKDTSAEGSLFLWVLPREGRKIRYT